MPVLQRYIKHQQLIEAVRRKVAAALTYPAVLILLAIGLIVILVSFVIPRFAGFYADFAVELPLLTQVVLGGSRWVQGNVWLLAGGLVIAYFVSRGWLRSEAGIVAIDRARLHIPFVGRIYRLFALSQFVRSLGALLAGGTPLVNALEIASGTVTNRAISTPLTYVAPRVREGQALWSSLEETNLFPEVSIAMVQIGEATGALEEMLFNVSQFYDDTIDVTLTRVVTLIEPIILVVMGGVVALLLLSVYLPMFTLLQQMR